MASRSDKPRAHSLKLCDVSFLILRKMTVFDKTESLVMIPCAPLSLLSSRRNCLTRRSCLNCMLIERMARQSCGRDRTIQWDTLSLLTSRRNCLTRSDTRRPWRLAGPWFNLKGVSGAQPSYPRSWRAQEGALPLSWRLAARQFNLRGVSGAWPSFPRSWRAQEGPLSSSWRSADRPFFHSHAHGESKKELCHHHCISQENQFILVIYLFACVSSLYI